MLSPFAPVIMPLLMTENGLSMANDSVNVAKDDGNAKSFKNACMAGSSDVMKILTKRPLSETVSEGSNKFDDEN